MSLRINDEIPNLKVVTDHGEMQLHVIAVIMTLKPFYHIEIY